MKNYFSKILFSFVFSVLVLQAPAAFAQNWEIELGAGFDIQKGVFTAPCACQYSDGSGYAIRAAVAYDYFSSDGLLFGMKPGVDYKQFASAHTYISPDRELNLRDSANISQTYLTVDPFVRYTFTGTDLFVQAAPSFAYVIGSHFYQHKTYLNGSRWGDGKADSTWEDGPLENSFKTRIAARVSAGYRFALFGAYVAPTVTADLPLSELGSADATNTRTSYWAITTIYCSLGVFFKI